MSEKPRITRAFLRSLPDHPGVYLMKDARGGVLYVGKAGHLRRRVKSYFLGHDDRSQVRYLLALVHSIETIVTEDERQALVLESDLIKKYKPRYNVRLKDDKAHLIVRIDREHSYPRLELVRRVHEDGAQYVGPFAFGYELKTMLEVIQDTLPIRSCSDRVFQNRVRPCLEYQIKRCSGPCCLPVDREIYSSWLDSAVDVLNGRNEKVLERLNDDMLQASSEQRYEDAAVIRDRIRTLQRVHDDRPATNFSFRSQDAVSFYSDGEAGELAVLSVRHGRLFGGRSFEVEEVALPQREVFSSLLSQYYQHHEDIPDEILVAESVQGREAFEQLLSERAGKRVRVRTPKRGLHRRLLQLAQDNARENFLSRHHQRIGSDRVLKKLQLDCGLEQMPRVVQCIDISHFQGGETVASLVQFRDGRADKAGYRHYILSLQGKPDDFASIAEVARRHLSRSAEENTLPDLLVIDGGMGQLNAALDVRQELGLSQVPMIGLAKKRRLPIRFRPYSEAGPSGRRKKPERIYLPGNPIPKILRSGDEALHLLERLRDEAHRFAISFHRRRRSQRLFRSPLDDIPGVGNKRKQAVLRAFGSASKMLEAPLEEVVERTGLPLAIAKRVRGVVRRRLRQKELDDADSMGSTGG